MDPGTCIRYLDWAIIILAAIYLLCLAVPVVVKEVIAFGKRGCIDCRSRQPCKCLDYRMNLAFDIMRLSVEAKNMLEYHKKNGWPSSFNDAVEHHLRLFIEQLDSTAELLKHGDTTVRSCFETIDGFCTFVNCLDCEPNLQEAVVRVVARRKNHPQSWPPKPNLSSWMRWE